MKSVMENKVFNGLILGFFRQNNMVLCNFHQMGMMPAHDDPECLTPTVLAMFHDGQESQRKSPLLDQSMTQSSREVRKSALMTNWEINIRTFAWLPTRNPWRSACILVSSIGDASTQWME